MTNPLITFAFTLCLAGAALGPAQAQEGNCLSNREIQNAIGGGEIAPLAEVLAMAGINAKPLEPVRVCNRQGQFYYVLNVIDEYGQTRNVVLNAMDGSQ